MKWYVRCFVIFSRYKNYVKLVSFHDNIHDEAFSAIISNFNRPMENGKQRES